MTIAKEIELEDPLENMGAQLVKEVASKTNDVAGDGTSTATVLAQAIVREGAKAVAAGMNPMDLKRGVDQAVEVVVADIVKRAKKVKTSEEIAQVGTISANGDVEVGEFIAEAMQKVGNEGVITVEEAKSLHPNYKFGGGESIVSTADIRPIIEQRCSVCHSSTPTQPGFSSAPAGLSFDENRVLEINAQRVFTATVTSKIMPPGNLSGMTDDERKKIADWFGALQQQ